MGSVKTKRKSENAELELCVRGVYAKNINLKNNHEVEEEAPMECASTAKGILN